MSRRAFLRVGKYPATPVPLFTSEMIETANRRMAEARRRLFPTSTTDGSAGLQEEPTGPSVEAHPEPRKEQRDV